jgi:hypothetical protein
MTDQPPQFRLAILLALRGAITISMPLLAFRVGPWLADKAGLHPGIALWRAMRPSSGPVT